MFYYNNSELKGLSKRTRESLQHLAYSNDNSNIDAIIARALFLFEELGEDISQLTISGDCIYGATYCFLINKKKMVIREDYERHLKRKDHVLFFLKISATVVGVGTVVAGVTLFIMSAKHSYDAKQKLMAQSEQLEEVSNDRLNFGITEKEKKIKELQEKNDANHVIDYGDPAPLGRITASNIYDEIARRVKSSSVIAVKDGDSVYFYTGAKRGTSIKYDELNRIDDIFTVLPELTFTVEEGEGLYEDGEYYGMTLVDEYHNVIGTLYMLEDEASEILGEENTDVQEDTAKNKVIRDESGNPIEVTFVQ